jgi:hypothetical protein
MYYNCAKCGSSTNYAYGNLLKHPDLLRETIDMSQKEGISARDAYYVCSNRNPEYTYRKFRDTAIINEKDVPTDAIRYCVVRNPVDRFISTYKGLISRGKYVEPMDVNTFTDIIDKDIAVLRKKWPEKTKNGWNNVKHHFEPQVNFHGKDAKVFTHIFDVGQMNDVKKMLENCSGINLPELQLNPTDDVKPPQLTKDNIDWIKRKYAKDYELYGKWMKL